MRPEIPKTAATKRESASNRRDEMVVAPRDLDLRLWRACTTDPTDVEMPSAFNDAVIHQHHDLRVRR